MLKTTSATIALLALSVSLAEPALAAGCASPAEAAALKTAVMQQELMVAALQCHEAAAYNHFVIAYRPELQESDAALKAFFVRRGGEHGEAGYDTFKTKAANLSALEQARDARAFCADAHALFEAALANRGSLMSFVQTRAMGSEIGNVCLESRPAPLPVREAAAAPVVVAPVPASAASVRIPTASAAASAAAPVRAPIKVAATHPADAAVGVGVGVGGVPSFSEPAIPYGDADAAPPPAPNGYARDAYPRNAYEGSNRDQEDEAQPAYATEEDAPPPPPRTYQIRSRPYSYYDYGRYAPPPPRPYGPPPGWSNYNYPAPPPGYGWYPRSGYYNW